MGDLCTCVHGAYNVALQSSEVCVQMHQSEIQPGLYMCVVRRGTGQWAVAMVDGRQVILDPANADNSTTAAGECQGNGIWIFRAQQLELGGPCAIDEKKSELFNVVRLQVTQPVHVAISCTDLRDRLVYG